MNRKKRITAALACICMLLLLCPVRADAKDNWYGRTVAQGETFEESDYKLYGYYDGCRFVNNGTAMFTGRFVMNNLRKSAEFYNNGEVTFNSLGVEFTESFEVGSDCTFVNKGTVSVDGAYLFLVQGTLVNEGTLFLSNIKNITPNGIENRGTIVYDEKTVGENLIKKLKEQMKGTGNLVSKADYDSSPGQTVEDKIIYDLNGGNWKTEPQPDDPIFSYPSNDKGYCQIGLDDPYDQMNKNAVREHYRLAGWTCEKLGITEPKLYPVIYSGWTGETTFKAVWEPAPYHVYYYLDGGSFSEGTDSPKVESGTDSVYTVFNIESEDFTLPTPEKSGYTFEGWVRGGGPVTDVQENVTIPKGTTGNVSYTAKWTPNGNIPYTVKVWYMNEKGNYSADPGITREEKGTTGDSVEIPSSAYAKQGFALDMGKSTVSGTISADGSLTLELYYKRDQHTITFKSYDGNTTIKTYKGYYNAPVELPDTPTYEEEGYTFTFKGWDDTPGSSYGRTSLGSVREDRTYYAAYEKVANFCEITFKKLEGVSEPKQKTVRVAKGASFEQTFTLKENYYVGTKEWAYIFKELGAVYSDGPGGLMRDEGFFCTVKGNGGPIVFSIPKVERDLDITLCAHYHTKHDYSPDYDKVLKKATCTEKGLVERFCYKCGDTTQEETEADASGHRKLDRTEAKPATYDEDGNIEYYHCADCKKYFRDPAGRDEISYKDTVIEKLGGKPGTDIPDNPDNPNPDNPNPDAPNPDNPNPDNPNPDAPDPDNPDTPNPDNPNPDKPGTGNPGAVINGSAGNTASFLKLNAKVIQTGEGFKVSWKRIANAEGYDIYAAKCGSNMRLAGSVRGGKASAVLKKISGKKINSRSPYKIQVRAYRIVKGKKKITAKSLILHIAGKRSAVYTNARSIKAAKVNVAVKKGKTARLQAKVVKERLGKKLLPKSHIAPLRYYSSDESVASVSKNGTVRGRKKGSCTVYAVAANGIRRAFKVTVK